MDLEVNHREVNEDRLLALVKQLITNDLIVTSIIKTLDVTGLKTFRLVCHDWYQKCSRAWSEKSFVHLKADDRKPSQDNFKDVEDFLEYMNDTTVLWPRTLDRYPLQNFSLKSFDPQRTECVHFFKTFGEEIRYLRLIDFDFSMELRQPMRDFGSNLRGLEITSNSSEIIGCTYFFQEGPVYTYLKKFILLCATERFDFKYIYKFPNLVNFQAELKGGHAMNLIPILCTFRYSKNKRNTLNLTTLDIMDSQIEVNGFFKADLPLKRLTLTVGHNYAFSSFSHDLLHYGPRLETLKLFRPYNKRLSLLPGFPLQQVFSNLRVLELWGNVTRDFNFLLATPSLVTLRVDVFCFEKKDYRGWSNEMACSVLKEDLVENSFQLREKEHFQVSNLVELAIDLELTAESWRTLKEWMPRLRWLQAPINSQALQVVCTEWKDLRKLKLRYGSNVDDDSITGLETVRSVHYQRHPNLTDLRFLESFQLEVGCGQGKLTDRSAEWGFLELKYLDLLQICVSPTELSSEMEVILKKKIGNVQIYRECRGVNQNGQELECCQWNRIRSFENKVHI